MKAIDMKFIPSRQGFRDFRNEGFIQQVCLAKAQEAAAIAGGACGHPFSCSVRGGTQHCVAKAESIGLRFHPTNQYYDELKAGKGVKEAAQMAAVSLGGEVVEEESNG